MKALSAQERRVWEESQPSFHYAMIVCAHPGIQAMGDAMGHL